MSERPTPKLIRLCCDCELTPEQAAELERCLQSHPEQRSAVESQVTAEKRLRECVGRVLKAECECAPAGLREQVVAALHDAPEDDRDADEPLKLSVWRRIFSNPNHANFLAVAASLAIVAGAVLVGIFGRTIDQIPSKPPVDLIASATLFADQEHGRHEAGISEVEQAEADLREWLGVPVDVFDLSDLGYEFIAAGPCDMPVPARSAHLTYQKNIPGSPRSPLVSVFMVPNTGGCKGELCKGLKSGEWRVALEKATGCKHKVLRATDGSLIYFLVCCDSGDLDAVKQRIVLTDAAGR